MVNQLTKEEKKDSLVYGAISGVLSIIFSIIAIHHSRMADSYSALYMVSTTLKVIGTVLIPIGLVYLLKRRNGIDWTFSRALKSIYIFLAASIVVSSIGIMVYQKVILDKTVLEESYQNLMNLKIVEMENRGATDDEIDQQMEIIEQDRTFAFSELSFRNSVPPIFISLLVNFVFAMVLALLFRTKVVKK
ncbi:DUF4199 domain-containing protein [Sphingobacterium paucimobilis]|uniref:DUF4199 domain-containing protein n=1 Tax=Sphingobacterium paucimobilis HER1398 TaxID=1346330 RepID=U2HU07_9SPHI|nr:DUF4199 domain-containing protein [Sphingobacterium paucimobilis]ERJ58765.1 hypothetical protein M472_08285 [Sphingobacterium paucimobilis HER1398]